MAGTVFEGDDSAVVAEIQRAIEASAYAAVELELNPECVFLREHFGPPSDKTTSFHHAWDIVDTDVPWDMDRWNWLELMNLRIRHTYIKRPCTLSWVFDKIAIQAFCEGCTEHEVTVPTIAAWRNHQNADIDSIRNAVEHNVSLIVKPIHGSEAVGITTFEDSRDAGLEAVSNAIQSAMVAKSHQSEPWMIRNVPQGVMIQELYKFQEDGPLTTPPFSYPLEIKVHTLFGRIICGILPGFAWHVIVMPNGSIYQWSRSRVASSSGQARGVPKAFRTAGGSMLPEALLDTLKNNLRTHWNAIAKATIEVAHRSHLDEIRVDWFLGDARFGPRINELQYIGAAGNIRPEIQPALCRGFLLGHKLRHMTSSEIGPEVS